MTLTQQLSEISQSNAVARKFRNTIIKIIDFRISSSSKIKIYRAALDAQDFRSNIRTSLRETFK